MPPMNGREQGGYLSHRIGPWANGHFGQQDGSLGESPYDGDRWAVHVCEVAVGPAVVAVDPDPGYVAGARPPSLWRRDLTANYVDRPEPCHVSCAFAAEDVDDVTPCRDPDRRRYVLVTPR